VSSEQRQGAGSVPFGDGQKPSVTGGHLVKLMTSMHRGEGVPVPLNATLVEQYGDLGEGQRESAPGVPQRLPGRA